MKCRWQYKVCKWFESGWGTEGRGRDNQTLYNIGRVPTANEMRMVVVREATKMRGCVRFTCTHERRV